MHAMHILGNTFHALAEVQIREYRLQSEPVPMGVVMKEHIIADLLWQIKFRNERRNVPPLDGPGPSSASGSLDSPPAFRTPIPPPTRKKAPENSDLSLGIESLTKVLGPDFAFVISRLEQSDTTLQQWTEDEIISAKEAVEEANSKLLYCDTARQSDRSAK